MGDTESGVRTVYPFNCCENRPVSVFCDQTTDGGGWTVFQHRKDLPKREDFYRKYVEYQLGFGNLTGEFWLGLENIHALGDKRWAKYEHFYVDDSSRKYRLNLGSYTGDAGDSLSRHDGAAFSAKDVDNDTNSKAKCAVTYKGAWWYVACHDSNLNGFQYKGTHTTHADGINWKHFRGHKYSLKSTLLSVRPRFTN
ncbi:UNVERIFIED_CONTAM: hypothetical protein GTU68_056534 [Idotea baltica]|nr:hypothetical protein [Idotea baltica]